MLGWRKRNDGFEWREYVRTTILVRREKRRQKIDDLREAAVNRVKEAGEKGVRAGAAGAGVVGRAAKAGLAEAGRSLNENVWQVLRRRAASGAGRGMAAARAAAGRVGDVAATPAGRKAALWVASVAAFWAAARSSVHGIDREVATAAAIAVAALAIAGLMTLAATPEDERGKAGEAAAAARAAFAAIGGGRVASAGIAIAVLLAAGWAYGWSIGDLTSAFDRTQRSGTATAARTDAASAAIPGVLGGRAVAVSGDTLRVGGRLIRLDGIEAPEREQTCALASGRTWSCGSGATQALAGRIKSKPVNCEVTGEDKVLTGICRIDGTDIAADLVRGGYVFAEAGWFARYAAAEGEAKEARVGLWRGEAQRPSEFRNRKWEEARKAAPDGCPIKGQKTSDRRVYVLPWSPQYDQVKVRTARGERWFCSEAEAQAAGWQPGERS